MNLKDYIVRITKQDEVQSFPKTKKPSPTKWKKAFHWLTANPHNKDYRAVNYTFPFQGTKTTQLIFSAKKSPPYRGAFLQLCGLDETRTRDPLRDRQVF